MLFKSLLNTDQCFRFTQPLGNLYLTCDAAYCFKQKLCYVLLKTVFNSEGWGMKIKVMLLLRYVCTIQTHNDH